MKEKIKAFLKIKPRTNNNHISKEEVKEGKFMATLSYIFAPLPYVLEKENDYVLYHAKQGMNLFLVTIIYLIITSSLRKFFVIKICDGICYYSVSPLYTFISGLFSIIIIIYIGIGIFNVFYERVAPLPLIGKLKIFK